MYHMDTEVYPTFPFPIQINWTRIPIYMQQSAIKSAISHKDKVVSHSFEMQSIYFYCFIINDVCSAFFVFIASSGAKKQISVSQHSSISQADDCSSPYARVRSTSHAYDKVRPAEHPYAQVKSIGENGNRPSTSASATVSSNLNAENNNPNENDSLSRRSSRESLLDSVDGRNQVSCLWSVEKNFFTIIPISRFTAGNSGSISNRR